MNHPDNAGSAATPELEDSSLVDALKALAENDGVEPELGEALRRTIDLIDHEFTPDAPFLSVILRTQGKRFEPFKDALTCLAAQTDQDFEVVVVDHDAEPEAAKRVREAIDMQMPSFRERIRVIEVSGGSRAKPLNAAIDVVKGRYVAVYDDDDILFANWVEEFHTASRVAGSRMLRSLTATQQVKPELWPQQHQGFRTISWPKAEYAPRFVQFDHFIVNHSPFMSWAFPRQLFSRLGYRFDEELSVCEDWDMILRGSLLLGVHDVPALTAIYRRWEGGTSSYTEHTRDSWAASEARVLRKLNASVLLLAPGTVTRVRELMAFQEYESARKTLVMVLNSRSWKLTRPLRGAERVAQYGRRLAGRAVRRIRRGVR
ncbi:glycosyltransferase family 2 protein [Leifsonia sp. LS-T14]|uniref:glycosyltransferase family 2 protein n=1 Tax=unclassified Leifsonia TaxID=2663824 RepID=UPI0035A5FA3F